MRIEDIHAFKKKLQEENLFGLALDIDETLADSNTHWFERMFAFHAPQGRTIENLLKEYAFVEMVPGWESQEALGYMEKLLHSEEFNETIPLIEESNHTVEKLHKKIPIIAYITARPESVREATKRWLARHNFPEAPIIMRTENVTASESDLSSRNAWKATVLKDLYPYVKGIIDDNTNLAHELQKLDYKGIHYLYGKDTQEFKDYNHVIVCPTWPSVLEKIRD